MFVIRNIQSFTSQILGGVSPLGEILDLFSTLGFEIHRNSDHETLSELERSDTCLSTSNDFKI